LRYYLLKVQTQCLRRFLMFNRLILIFTIVLFSSFTIYSQTKLLRFPDVSGEKVVFTYGGDLWTSSISGGLATRLTTHPGMEVFAKFSPDGKWIAFTGQYDGDEQVYVVSANGGEPKQLTFYPAKGPFTPRWGYDNLVYGWSRDGKSIFFKGHRDSWTLSEVKLYKVSADGGSAEALPMPEAGSGDYSPDGMKMVYSPRSRDFRPEKRYAGGQANTLYIYDLATNDAKKISDNPRVARDAMWIGDTIYYNSDKDGKFNLYAYDTKTSKTTQTTTYKDWEIRWCSSDNQSKIIYERNGELEIFDVNSKKANQLTINVPDDGVNRRNRVVNVAGFVENYSLSPKGERAVFAARGDIFSVPIEKGSTRNLTKSSKAHDKQPSWSPDGKQIAFISDKSGEEEIWLVAQDGNSAATQLTTGGQAMRYVPSWSPDGKIIAFSDKDGKIYLVNVADKLVKQIVDAPRGQVVDYEWSPKGNFIAFSMGGTNGFSSVYLYEVATNKLNKVTNELYDSSNPTFDPNGNYLYFLSDREFAPLISGVEFNYAANKSAQIYALALRKDVKNPFPAESDEVTITEEKKADTPIVKPETKPDPKPETIDFDGIVGRATKVPLAADNYGGLSAKTGHLIYTVNPPFYYGRSGGSASLRIFSIKDRKETTLSDPAFGYTLSPDGSKILTNIGGGYALFDASPLGVLSRKLVSINGLVTEINPQEEWNQIFNEVWRRYRDWFYVQNMHGYDWAKIREQYKQWLPHVAHRSDLNYVISEMCSELAVQHAYIEGGDFNLPTRVRVALAGARFEADKVNNRYKISRIFGGQNEEDIYRSPLTEVGNDVKVGDYIIAINGENVTTDKDIYAYLRGKADSAVQLTINSTPTANGSRTITYRPLADEGNLVYLNWITSNREKVSQLSNGRLGYLHIPDMGNNGIREFIKYFYGQTDKEGLVVDVRANGGGNVSRMLIERLRRKVLGVNFSRTDDQGNTYPDGVFIGPMVSILNENSSSDGDIFPYMFREAGLGTLIGKRSWGGVVGIQSRGPLLDGGQVSVPGSALANTKGEYVIEGYGVDPDIEVENDPKSVIAGKDPQLERAIDELMKKLTKPVKLPNRPKEPVKLNE
jgi:tricorn protease